MLGKQWLNRYMSTDMRGTAIERSQNRQQKLNGIVSWYFDTVMESLPVMLQIALLLLGCALSQYLWEMDMTVASVTLGATSLGILFYLFIVIAGSASASCPYQTPASRILQSTTSALISATLAVAPAFRHAYRASATVGVFQSNARHYLSRGKIMSFLRDVLCELPPALASDGVHLGQATIQSLVALIHQLYTWLPGISSTQTHGVGQQATLLDLHCISWILRTSLDKDHHLSAMEYLVTMLALPNFDPSLVAGCFGALISCINVTDGTVVVTQGLEKLATLSATCFFHTFSHLSVMSPSSDVLVDVHQKYIRLFPPSIKFSGLPFHYTFAAIHSTLYPGWRPQGLEARIARRQQAHWGDYKPSSWEDIVFTHALTKLAQSEYQRRKKVLRWILHFVLHTLAIYPLPSISIIVDCLSIIAISLDCDISEVGNMAPDERYVHI